MVWLWSVPDRLMNRRLGPQQAMLFWEVVEAFSWGSHEGCRSLGWDLQLLSHHLFLSLFFLTWHQFLSLDIRMLYLSSGPKSQMTVVSNLLNHKSHRSIFWTVSGFCHMLEVWQIQWVKLGKGWNQGWRRKQRKGVRQQGHYPGLSPFWLGEAVYICPGWPLNSTQLRAEVRWNRLVRNAWQMSMVFSKDTVSGRC